MPAALPEKETDADESVLAIETLTGAPWFPPLIDPQFFDFIKTVGRVPRLGDSRPPYSYKGWMLFQVWMLSGARGIHSRWIHYFETLAAGRPPDRPVPPLDFRPAEDAKGRVLRALGKMVEKLGRCDLYRLGSGVRTIWFPERVASTVVGLPHSVRGEHKDSEPVVKDFRECAMR